MDSTDLYKSEVILSICIATYNRGKFIGATLESIVAQISEGVEIIVVDGASTDNTKSVVLNYQEKFSYIKYYQLHEKGGVDRDYCRAVELATGMYCWLFTDDDILNCNAIATVMTAIRDGEYALLIANASSYSRDLDICYRNKFVNFSSNKKYSEVTEQEQFFIDMANILSFIGCVIIKRDLWNKRNKELYFGTEFIHVGVIFQEYITEKILFISEPLISIRMNNSQWSNRAFKIWIIKWPQLIWSFRSYSDNSKRKICPRHPEQNLWKLLYYRALGYYSLSEYKNHIQPSNPNISKFMARLILILPCSLVNLFMIAYASFRHRPWMVEELMQHRRQFNKSAKLAGS